MKEFYINDIVEMCELMCNDFNIDEAVTIKEVRELTNKSQRSFSEYFGIPLRTLQEWEQGRRKPPYYVVDMIKRIWELENH